MQVDCTRPLRFARLPRSPRRVLDLRVRVLEVLTVTAHPLRLGEVTARVNATAGLQVDRLVVYVALYNLVRSGTAMVTPVERPSGIRGPKTVSGYLLTRSVS